MDSPQVLIIDDDKDVSEYYGSVLKLMSFQVEMVKSAKEALSRLSGSAPDLILLDMNLGMEIGGEDILYQIRSNPRFDQTRVVVVTGYPATVMMVTNLADLILIKPISVDLLQTLVTRILASAIEPKRFTFRDPVTMLFNKEFFFTRLELAFERARRRHDFLFAVLIFEIQLAMQDEMLLQPDVLERIIFEVAERLKGSVRPTDTVARVSGWKFVSLHEDLTKREDAEIIVDRIYKLLTEPIRIGDKQYHLDVRFGRATQSPRFTNPVDLFVAAEQDLARAIEP